MVSIVGMVKNTENKYSDMVRAKDFLKNLQIPLRRIQSGFFAQIMAKVYLEEKCLLVRTLSIYFGVLQVVNMSFEGLEAIRMVIPDFDIERSPRPCLPLHQAVSIFLSPK